ncbi:MAG: SEC-C metal-binding domain-containing protein [Lachnospiraceae bacterium]|nr:SEC-C metal-binding domain-containing protein [Lachnospiraceae bacterium]
MALLEQWQNMAYDQSQNQSALQQFWNNYFMLEKGVYEQLLTNPTEKVSGTVKELADKYDLDIMAMTGFLDGINDSLVTPNPIDTMEEDTKVSLEYNPEALYKNMVDAKADWLYELPQWDEIFDAETKKKLYREAKNLHTVRNTVKVGRNDPCPCGSGRKYKQCCGKK